LHIVRPFRPFAPSQPHSDSAAFITHQCQHSLSKGLAVSWCNQYAGYAIEYLLLEPPCAGSHDGQRAGHGLEHDVAHSLCEGGTNEQIGGTQERPNIRNLADKPCSPEFTRPLLDPGLRFVTSQDEGPGFLWKPLLNHPPRIQHK